jgi:hypothetical protein
MEESSEEEKLYLSEFYLKKSQAPILGANASVPPRIPSSDHS